MQVGSLHLRVLHTVRDPIVRCRIWSTLWAWRAAAAGQRAWQQHHAWEGGLLVHTTCQQGVATCPASSPKDCVSCRSIRPSAKRSRWWQPRQVQPCSATSLQPISCFMSGDSVDPPPTGDGQQCGHYRGGRLGPVRAQRVQANADCVSTAIHQVLVGRVGISNDTCDLRLNTF